MRILRVFAESFRLLTGQDINRIGQAAIQSALAHAWATRLKNADGTDYADGARKGVVLGSGLRVTANGGSNQVFVSAGMALLRDPSITDIWQGSTQVALVPNQISISLAENNSGLTRLDKVVLYPKLVETDKREGTFADPDAADLMASLYKKSTPYEMHYTYEVDIIEGEPAAVPVAEDTPPGAIDLAIVTRASGVLQVTQAEIADNRGRDLLTLGKGLVLDAVGASIRFGTVLDHAILQRVAQTQGVAGPRVPQQGELMVTEQGYTTGAPNGRVRMGNLAVHGRLDSCFAPIAVGIIGGFNSPGASPTDGTSLSLLSAKGTILSATYRVQTLDVAGTSYPNVPFIEVKLAETTYTGGSGVPICTSWHPNPTLIKKFNVQMIDGDTLRIFADQFNGSFYLAVFDYRRM